MHKQRLERRQRPVAGGEEEDGAMDDHHYGDHDDLQHHLSGMNALDYARQQVLQQQQQAAIQAQQQAFQQYQAALEARLMLQQQQQQHEHLVQQHAQNDDHHHDLLHHHNGGHHFGLGRSRTPDAASLLGGLYPAPELQQSELGSLIMLQQQDEVNAGILNSRVLQHSQHDGAQQARPRVPFHPATGVAGFRTGGGAAEAAIPLILNTDGGGPPPQQQLGYGSAAPYIPKGPPGPVLPMESLGRSGCNCKKSRCLKLYCQCFAALVVCGPTCNCIQCLNLPSHENIRQDAIRAITDRNPNAFQSKFRPAAGEAVHKLGCKCRKSACLKKYCECFNMGARCTDKCICIGCQNRAGVGRPFGSDTMIGTTQLGSVIMNHHPQLGSHLPGAQFGPPGSRPPSAPPTMAAVLAPPSPASAASGKQGTKKRKTAEGGTEGPVARAARHDEDDTDMLQAAEDLALLKAGPVKGKKKQAAGGGGGQEEETEDEEATEGASSTAKSQSASFVRPSILRSKAGSSNKRSLAEAGLGGGSGDDVSGAGSSAVLDSINSSSSGLLDEEQV